jgi:hypothetical protein
LIKIILTEYKSFFHVIDEIHYLKENSLKESSQSFK